MLANYIVSTCYDTTEILHQASSAGKKLFPDFTTPCRHTHEKKRASLSSLLFNAEFVFSMTIEREKKRGGEFVSSFISLTVMAAELNPDVLLHTHTPPPPKKKEEESFPFFALVLHFPDIHTEKDGQKDIGYINTGGKESRGSYWQRRKTNEIESRRLNSCASPPLPSFFVCVLTSIPLYLFIIILFFFVYSLLLFSLLCLQQFSWFSLTERIHIGQTVTDTNNAETKVGNSVLFHLPHLNPSVTMIPPFPFLFFFYYRREKWGKQLFENNNKQKKVFTRPSARETLQSNLCFSIEFVLSTPPHGRHSNYIRNDSGLQLRASFFFWFNYFI